MCDWRDASTATKPEEGTAAAAAGGAGAGVGAGVRAAWRVVGTGRRGSISARGAGIAAAGGSIAAAGGAEATRLGGMAGAGSSTGMTRACGGGAASR